MFLGDLSPEFRTGYPLCKIFQKSNISLPLIRRRRRNNRLQNFGYVLNGRFLTILQDWNLVHCQKNYIFYILRFVKINSDEYLGVLFLTSSQVLLVLSQYILFGSLWGKVLWIHACLLVCTSVSTSVVLYLAFLEICSLVFPGI